MTADVPGIAGREPAGSAGIAAVQARINEIQSRFIGGGVRFSTVLADQIGALRTASSSPGTAPDGLPAGLSPAVELARQYLGVPYVWGGESPSGFDCSGLIQFVYRQLGVELPRVSADQARAGRPVASLAEALPGDLVAFGHPVDHIGIYAGDGRMVVAPKAGDVVKVQSVYEEPTAIRRVLPPGQGGGPASSPVFRSDLGGQRAMLLSLLGGAW